MLGIKIRKYGVIQELNGIKALLGNTIVKKGRRHKIKMKNRKFASAIFITQTAFNATLFGCKLYLRITFVTNHFASFGRKFTVKAVGRQEIIK
jgi:hypothetical protein